MPDLSTTYMGLKLKNPVIAGASGLTGNMDTIKRLEDGGAAALVTKSLFEEQIQLERFKYDEDLEKDNYRHAEMVTLHPHPEFAGADEHLMWVGKAKEAVGIPVIASLNAVNMDTWVEYASRLEQTGVDALECNLFASPGKPEARGADIEAEQADILKKIKAAVSIPVSLKLSCLYTNPINVAHRLGEAGADALVLFNRFFEPDLDVGRQEHVYPFNFSHENDYRLSLRYAGLLEGHIAADVCCSTGIFSGETVVKMLLAGASAVQTVSALYSRGPGHTQDMVGEIETWMDKSGYASIADFKGKLSKRHCSNPRAYTRAQYAHLLMNPSEIERNFPGS